jgi:hypothetical protein
MELLSKSSKSRASASLLTALIFGSSGVSFADTLGYRAYQQEWDPAKPTVTDVKQAGALYGGLSTDLVNAWTQFTAKATPVWTSALSVPDLAGKGYTLENPRLQVSGVESTELRTSAVADRQAPAGFQSPSSIAPVLVIHSSGTRLDAGSTSPYTTHDTDPTFHVTFDLTAYIRLTVGPRVSAVSVPSAVVVLSNAQYTPDNATANEAQSLAFLQSFFGATPFADTITGSINGQNINITGWLGPAIRTANDELRRQAPPGYVVAGVFADPQYLNFVLAPRVQPTAGGQMAGTLTVTGESNLPVSARAAPPAGQDCSRFINLSDTVQVQPDYVASLNPVTFQTGSGLTQKIDSQIVVNGGTIIPAANGWSCRYSVSGLADRMLNTVNFVEPTVKASNGSLPSVGYVIDVNFAGCSSVSGSALNRVSDIVCLNAPVCSDTLLPPNGQPLNCGLVGLIALSGNGGVGVLKQSVFANPNAVNPGGPVQKGATVSPTVWGVQNVSRGASSMSTSTWAAAGGANAVQMPAMGSSLGRSAGTSLQNRPVQLPASAIRSQF